MSAWIVTTLLVRQSIRVLCLDLIILGYKNKAEINLEDVPSVCHDNPEPLQVCSKEREIIVPSGARKCAVRSAHGQRYSWSCRKPMPEDRLRLGSK